MRTIKPRTTARGAAVLSVGVSALLGILLALSARAAAPAPAPAKPRPEQLPPPVDDGKAGAKPERAKLGFDDGSVETRRMPINLQTALQLAQTANLDIAQAREVVNQAAAALSLARVAVVPNFNLGSEYAAHAGSIAKTEGNVETVNKTSLFVGGGPSLTFQTAEAYFGPQIARRLEEATVGGLRRVNNDTLLAVADAYFSVLRARRRLARVGETLGYLTAESITAQGEKFKGLLPLVRDVVELGGKEAFRSDVARVEVEVLRRREEQAAAFQDLQIASADLARLLRLNPEVLLTPVEDFRYPMPLPGDSWVDQPTDDLLAFAVANRPELAQDRALVQAALARVRTAKLRPFMPNVSLTYNYGDFGGGPDLNPPIVTVSKTTGKVTTTTQPGFEASGNINHFEPRTDFDATLIWRLQNMGFGNRAEKRGQEAAQRQAVLHQQQTQELVMTQVVQSQEVVQRSRQRLNVTRSALFNARGAMAGPVFQSLRLNFERIRGGEGRPLEALDSIRGLSDTLEAYGQDVTDYERARFHLLIALGVPPQAFVDPKMPFPAPPAK